MSSATPTPASTVPAVVTPTPGRAWLVVGLLCVVGLLNYLDRNMIVTMRGSVVDAIPMSDAQFGLLTSAFLWVYGLLSPFAGFLADRFSRSRVIICSLFVWSAVTWLTAHTTTFGQLLAMRALMGISQAAYIPAALALIADYHRGPTRSLATGVHISGIMVGSGLSGIGGWIAEHHGWTYAFSVFGAFGVAYSGLLLFLLRDSPRDRGVNAAGTDAVAAGEPPPRFFVGLVNLFRDGAFLMAVAFWGLLGLTGWAVTAWMPTYFTEQFNLGQGEAGLSATGYLQGAAIFGVLVGGAWADRWNRTNPRARILVPAIGLCVAAPGVFLAANTGHVWVAIAGLMVYGFTRVFSDANMMPILCLVADPRYRATGYGVLNLVSCVVGGLAAYAGGALRDANINLSTVFAISAGSLVVCALLLFLLKPRR